MSIIPVRCYTCGKVLATTRIYGKYQEYTENGMSTCDALNKIGLTRYCCRRILLCHVNTIETTLMYKDPVLPDNKHPAATQASVPNDDDEEEEDLATLFARQM